MPLAARRVYGEPKSPGSSPNTGERAFAYAKACGIIGRSFIGKRTSALGKLQSLPDLNRLVFPEAVRELPGRELLIDLEGRILQRTTRQILAIIKAYSNPPELLIRQLRSCEYADLKTCLHYISTGKPNPPALSDIGHFRTIRFGAYPDLVGMLAGTEFDFILKKDLKAIKSADYDPTPLEAELDMRYYALLVQSLRRLSAADRQYARQILADEISLRNCVWALRLRIYFKKSVADTGEHLMNIRMGNPPKDVAAEARQLLQFPLDARSAWKDWRWESLLNPEKTGGSWTADPRYFQNAASQYIYRLSLRYFRLMSSSVSSIFCYIKLKQFEEDILTSITEGLGLGMAGKDVFALLEVPS